MNRREWLKTNAGLGAGFLLSPAWNIASEQPATDLVIDWQHAGKPLRHSWEGLGNVDQMRWMLRRDMQEQLKMAHDELNLRHVRAVGLFDDELRVMGPDPSRFFEKNRSEPRVNWQIPDYLFDSLLSIGINPVVTTCFMPSALASDTTTTFTTRSNITPPKNYESWRNLVKDCIQHYQDRYGKELLKNWYYEVWNEPNLDGFWTGGIQEYFKLYQVTYEAIKSCDPDLRIGGPSTARAEYMGEFLEFASKNDCMPEYIIGHCYNNDSANAPLSPFEGPQQDRENKSPNFTAGVVRGVKNLLEEFKYKGEVHWNEWGLSWHPYAPVRETANEAAFIVKTMHEVSQLGDYFAYWCLSDIYDQVGYNREAFAGHYGMINLYGLRKPNYFAHQLLTKMGNRQIPASSRKSAVNAFASKNTAGYQLLLYAFDIAYQASDPSKEEKVSFILPGNFSGKAQIYKIDSRENNVLYQWRQTGSPAYLKPDEIEYLRGINQLTRAADSLKISESNGQNIAEISMESPGVCLILLSDK